MVDDKETKNIDGIKPADVSQESTGEQISVNVKKDESAPATDVSINSDGDIAVEEKLEEPEAPTPPEELVPQAEEKQEDSSPVDNDDPGIVPSVQPTVSTTSALPATEVARLTKRNKRLKLWLVILMLLLVAVASALVVYFGQQSKAKSDLSAQQEQNAALQQQLNDKEQTATQKTIDDLNTQLTAEKTKNTELQAEIVDLEKQVTAYQTAVKNLLEACGTACSAVDVPEEDTATGNNTTN